MPRPEVGDWVTVDDRGGEVLKATTGPHGQPFAIIGFPGEVEAVHNNDIDEIEKAPHNER